MHNRQYTRKERALAMLCYGVAPVVGFAVYGYLIYLLFTRWW